MLGVCLLYVGMVLINNGITRLYKIDGKSSSIMNIFTGLQSIVINIISLVKGDYYSAGTGLLFGFTYLFVAINGIYKLDQRPFGWYSLFVAINTIPFAIVDYHNGDWKMTIIWILWGILWFTGFLENVCKKNIEKYVPYLSIFEGIFTGWIPGLLMILNIWN